MKRTIYMALMVVGFTSCKKEAVTPCNNVETAFQSQLIGNYKQVGFKNGLFPTWSYSSAGPQFQITQDSLTGIYGTKYQVMDQNTIYLQQQNQLVDVAFGDTVVFSFQNGDSTKLVKL